MFFLFFNSKKYLFQVKNLEHACRPVYVDLTFMFELDKIRLRGFRDDVSRVPYSEIMKEAERHVNARRHADLMSKQVCTTAHTEQKNMSK